MADVFFHFIIEAMFVNTMIIQRGNLWEQEFASLYGKTIGQRPSKFLEEIACKLMIPEIENRSRRYSGLGGISLPLQNEFKSCSFQLLSLPKEGKPDGTVTWSYLELPGVTWIHP